MPVASYTKDNRQRTQTKLWPAKLIAAAASSGVGPVGELEDRTQSRRDRASLQLKKTEGLGLARPP